MQPSLSTSTSYYALSGRMATVLERITSHQNKRFVLLGGERPFRSAFINGYVGNRVGIDRSVSHCHLDAVANLRALQHLEMIAVAVSVDGANTLRPRQSRGREVARGLFKRLFIYTIAHRYILAADCQRTKGIGLLAA